MALLVEDVAAHTHLAQIGDGEVRLAYGVEGLDLLRSRQLLYGSKRILRRERPLPHRRQHAVEADGGGQAHR